MAQQEETGTRAPQPVGADDKSHALPTERMPGATTPTWEIELLVSGAVVFSLLKMPGALDTLFQQWSPRLVAEWMSLVFLAYVYMKAAALALVSTFVAHLITRGYWVALVGLRSVYPEGVRWDKVRSGPAYRSEAKRVTPKLIELIDATDNFASLIFAFGALLVLMALMSFVYVVPSMAITAILVYFTKLRWDNVFLMVLAATFLPLLLTMTLDNLFGSRIREDSRLGRAIRLFYRLYNSLPFSRLTNGMMLTFTSNVGARKGTAIVVVAIWSVIAAAMYSALVARGTTSIDNYSFVPAGPGITALEATHYERTRTGGIRYSTMPFIPDEVVQGRYLRLFVPYDPSRHGHAMERTCPGVGQEPDDDADRTVHAAWRSVVLFCLQKAQPVWLDGKRLEVQYDFATDPKSEMRGMLAHIPVWNLDRGRHELTIARLPVRMRDPENPANAEPKARSSRRDEPYRIPFWR
jgi:hypothetical protein